MRRESLDTSAATPLRSRPRGGITGKAGRNSGFTLSEVVIASVLLLVAIVPILKALTIAQVTANSIEHKTVSLALAQSKLDRIKILSVYDWAGSFDESSAVLDGSYLCDVADTWAAINLRTIAVAVGFDQDGSSTLEAGEIEVTLTSLVAKRL